MTVRVELDSKRLEAPCGASLFDCAERLGIQVPTSCFRQGKCRECLVEVTEGKGLLSAPSPEETHLGENFRLSCRARVNADEGVVRAHTLRRGSLRIEKESLSIAGGFPRDPAVTRRGSRILLDGEPIAERDGPTLGIAMDVGTTTVVLRLVALESGTILGVESFENPQRFGGSDIMARIRYDGDHPGRALQRALLAYVKHAIHSFSCDPGTIFEVVVAGNTTMRDLFFGLPVQTVGQRPYRSVTEHEVLEGNRSTTALTVPARRLGLPVAPRARVYGLPLLSGHVGADAAACLLAMRLMDEDRLVAVMDIGTNTEILVGKKGKIFCASCPAGPAFEGGGLRCGMPALAGAVERISLREDDRAECTVIGGAAPQGICGSGLIDLLGELRRLGRMNSCGRLEQDRFVVDAERGLAITEEEISLLAQAKGANMAGLRIVLERYGADFQDLERFYLAGGFARHIDLQAAKRIGLIPNLPDERLLRVGNASLEGATAALLSTSLRKRLEETARSVTHVELETHPQFFDVFVEACQFVPVETHVVQND